MMKIYKKSIYELSLISFLFHVTEIAWNFLHFPISLWIKMRNREMALDCFAQWLAIN